MTTPAEILTDNWRQLGVTQAYLPLKIGDDWPVGGTEAVQVVSKLRRQGPRHVHVRRRRRQLSPYLDLQCMAEPSV